jgi:hypothetical protein
MRYWSLLAPVVLFHPGTGNADHLNGLDIVGVPANAGPWTWPADSEFSWISRRFPQSTSRHSWRLHPGINSGILFSSQQPPEYLTSEFLMFNKPTTIFSVSNGVTLNINEDINMDNLRKRSGQIAHGDLAPASQGDGALTIADVHRLLTLINTSN